MNSLKDKAKLVRKWSMISTTEAGSGHPTSCLSAADLMTVLFDKYYKYDLKNPLNLANDRLIFSKGHAAPLFYVLYALSGAFPLAELKTLRKFNSRLEGHPTPQFPYTEAATGSLGQGLSVGAGLALAQQRESVLKTKPHVYVLLGDGEMAEGQIWEAANFASYYKLNNLVAIVDVNRLGQSQETMFGNHVEAYANRLTSFGWEVAIINGHDMDEIEKAFAKATTNKSEKPFAIVAQTEKGHGISFLSNHDNWHGKPLPKDKLEEALKELGPLEDKVVFALKTRGPASRFPLVSARPAPSASGLRASESPSTPVTPLTFQHKLGEQIATREIYGKVLAEIGSKDNSIVVLDAEVKNSTYSIDFLKAHPDRFVECFIAEQNMVSVAAGFSRFGKKPFVSTFAAFFTRAFDQIRMAWLSGANIKFVGSHAGVSIGEDGSSQMGLEEIALFGALPGVVILQPSDGVSAAKLLEVLANTKGMAYLQTLRPKTAIIYDTHEEFSLGGSKVLKQNVNDVLSVVATGITVEEALKAYNMLKKENISIRVIDAYSLSPIDGKTLIASANATKIKTLIAVEDHFIHGGLGDFVLAAVAKTDIKVHKMAVAKHSHSGTKEELLKYAGIDAASIVTQVKEILQA